MNTVPESILQIDCRTCRKYGFPRRRTNGYVSNEGKDSEVSLCPLLDQACSCRLPGTCLPLTICEKIPRRDEATKQVRAMFLDPCVLPLQLIASGLIEVQRRQQSTPHRVNRLYGCMRASLGSMRVYTYDITIAPPIGGYVNPIKCIIIVQ